MMRKNDLRAVLYWVVGLTVALLALGLVIRNERIYQMDRGAKRSAQQWAKIVEQTVPDFDVVLTTGVLSAEARNHLLRLRNAGDVFRFKLFDRNGTVILISDDLENPILPKYDSSKDGIGDDHAGGIRTPIRDQVLAGTPYTELHQGDRPDRPSVYSEAYVPITHAGQVIGAVEVYVNQTEITATTRRSLTIIVGAVTAVLLLIGIITAYLFWQRLRQQRRSDDRVRYMAKHDVLSGAMNRTSFSEALSQAALRTEKKGGPAFSLLCIDLDKFKEVNDSLGHAAGDQVLRIATQRLKACLREGDQVARLGGDEFAILLMGLSTTASVTPLAQRIVQTLAAPFELSDQRVYCGGSVGIAIYGVDGTEAEDLMIKADLALYRAKADGRGTFSFYDIAMDRQMKSRRELTRDLRDAILTGQMSVHYQPLHGSDGKALMGYEALLRWQHPDRGNVTPAQFIPLAEETGLIDDIGLWVLRRACTDAASWPPPLTVAVNLSAAQFTRGNLVEQVSQALADSGLPAGRLELEITESLLMNNSEQVMKTLQSLAAMGVSIAMDDFGTGYSSLAYLWRFPFNKVKIDRAFTHSLVDDPKVGKIVHSIVTLAHSLDIRVNAEGVETPSQMAALQEHGCDELQGFLLGRPGPLKGLTHAGFIEGQTHATRRGEARESLFASLPMDLPPTPPNR